MDKDVSLASIREGYRLQRRNLVAISTIVCLYDFLGVTLDRINILGNELSVVKPDHVMYVLYGALLYFFVRFFGYFHDYGDKEFLKTYRAILHSKVLREMVFSQVKKRKNAKYRLLDWSLLDVGERSAEGKVTYQVRNGDRTEQVDFSAVVKGNRFRLARFLAVCALVLKSRLVFEFVFPFFAFALAMTAAAYRACILHAV